MGIRENSYFLGLVLGFVSAMIAMVWPFEFPAIVLLWLVLWGISMLGDRTTRTFKETNAEVDNPEGNLGEREEHVGA